MQFFKGDATEQKMYAAAAPTIDLLSLVLSTYFTDAYGSVEMGELLFDSQRIPLTNAIRREIFITCFKQILMAWAYCGTFESYLTVFRKIFGEDAEIEFTVPGPGKLTIDVTSSGTQNYNFIAREIVDNDYVFSNIVDYDDNQIVFQAIQGIDTEAELITVLFTMVPGGIFTDVSLTIG